MPLKINQTMSASRTEAAEPQQNRLRLLFLWEPPGPRLGQNSGLAALAQGLPVIHGWRSSCPGGGGSRGLRSQLPLGLVQTHCPSPQPRCGTWAPALVVLRKKASSRVLSLTCWNQPILAVCSCPCGPWCVNPWLLQCHLMMVWLVDSCLLNLCLDSATSSLVWWAVCGQPWVLQATMEVKNITRKMLKKEAWWGGMGGSSSQHTELTYFVGSFPKFCRQPHWAYGKQACSNKTTNHQVFNWECEGDGEI